MTPNGGGRTVGRERAGVAALVAAVTGVISASIVLSGRALGGVTFQPFDWTRFSASLLPLLVIAVLIERVLEVFFGIWREPDDRRAAARLEAARAAAAALRAGTAEGVARAMEVVAARARRVDPGPIADAALAAAGAAVAMPLATVGGDGGTTDVARHPEAEGAPLGVQPADRERVTRLVERELRDATLTAVEEGGPALLLPAAVSEASDAAVDVADRKAENTRIAFLAGGTLGLVVSMAGVRVLSLMVDPAATKWPGGRPSAWWTAIDVLLTAGLLGGGAGGFHQFTSVIGTFLEATRKKAERAAERA